MQFELDGAVGGSGDTSGSEEHVGPAESHHEKDVPEDVLETSGQSEEDERDSSRGGVLLPSREIDF